MNTATVDSLLHWLLRTSIEASILILAVLGLRMMLGTRLSPAWRIGLWMLVGAKLMLPAFIPASFGLGGWFPRSASMANAYSPDLPSAAQSTALTLSPTTLKQAVASGLPTHSRSIISSTSDIRHSPFVIRHLLLGLWLAGVVFVLMAALVRQRRFDTMLRQRPRGHAPLLRALVASLAHKAGIKKPVTVVLMPAGTTPAIVGLSQPKLLLPEDWEQRFDERSLRHVVLHELLHVRQSDLIWNWAAMAVQALHWFNPLVWFVVSRFQADRELRCDAGALEILAPSERLDYGHTLLRIQETFFAPPAIAGLAPCVRNHPTLRQRILMIAHPTTRQPWLHALLVLTLSVLVCYSFTTARAAEKEVPPKVRGGETVKKPAASDKSDSSEKKPAMKDGEREGGTKKPGTRDGEGGVKKPGTGDGEGGKKPSGPRDGEGGVKKPGTGDGEGGKKPTGPRDGEGGVKKPGTGDGEGGKKPSGPRDGEGGVKKPGTGDGEKPRTGARDGEGEGGTKKPGARDGEGSTKVRKGEGDAATSSGETITLRVSKNGETVMVGDKEVAMSGLRGHLSNFLPEHPGAKIIVTGDADTPLGALHNTVDAVRDNGNKNVGIKAE